MVTAASVKKIGFSILLTLPTSTPEHWIPDSRLAAHILILIHSTKRKGWIARYGGVDSYDKRYEQVFWPACLQAAFPGMPTHNRTRAYIQQEMESIRYLRNRVFHREPIWRLVDLHHRHDTVIDAIGWLNPTLKLLVVHHNEFLGYWG